MRKVCGLTDHNKSERFRNRCDITHADLKSERAMMYDGA